MLSFEGPGGVQTHTEVGPSLLEVLAAAGVAPTLNTWVAAVGDDNYVATVTSASVRALIPARFPARVSSR